MAYNVNDVFRKLDEERLGGETTIQECITRLRIELAGLMKWQRGDPELVASDGLPRNSFYPIVRRDDGNYLLEGNGKSYTFPIDGKQTTLSQIVEKFDYINQLGIDCIKQKIDSLEAMDVEEKLVSKVPSIAENPAVKILVSRNELLENKTEPNTYIVVSSLPLVVQTFIAHKQTITQPYVRRYFRKFDGSQFTEDSIRVTLNSNR